MDRRCRVAEAVTPRCVVILVNLGRKPGNRVLVDRQGHETPGLRSIFQHGAGIGGLVARRGMKGVQIVIAAIAAHDERRRLARRDRLLDPLIVVDVPDITRLGTRPVSRIAFSSTSAILELPL